MKKNVFLSMLILVLSLSCSHMENVETLELPTVPAVSYDLVLSIDSPMEFKRDFESIRKALSESRRNIRVTLNVLSSKYTIIKLKYDTQGVDLVIRNNDLYLLGFITRNNKYYYFNDANITRLQGTTPSKLPYNGSYASLTGSSIDKFDYQNLISYIGDLANCRGQNLNALKKILSKTIFVTSEALRFKPISEAIAQGIKDSKDINAPIFMDDIKNWNTLSKKAIAGDANSMRLIDIAKRQ